MKKIIQNKKRLICVIVTLIMVSLIVGGIFLFSKNNEEKIQNKKITNNYVAYIRINPLIKIEYSQTCKNENCNDPIVTNYELVNDDAKNIYKDIDLIGTNNKLYDVITIISKTADENNIEFENVEIYSNWDNLNNYIDKSNKDNYKWSYIVNIRDKENLEDISSSLIENKILYTVSFNTDGGTEINSQTVEKDNLAKEPTTPSKKGYKFVEWQLDNNKFDFNTKITSDITLIAKWQKEETPTNNNSDKNENKQDKPTKNEHKTKEVSINDIEARNTNDKYVYNFTKKETIKISITGKEDLINNLNEKNIKLFIDASGLNTGTHNVDIKVSGIDSNLTYILNPKNISITIKEKPKAYLNFGDLYSLERVKEIENKYNIKIKLIADAKCGYIEGGDEQLIESGKTYTVHINSLDPYVQGACGDSGQGTIPEPENWECYNDTYFCAPNLMSKPDLLNCAKQLAKLDNDYWNYVNTNNKEPLISEMNLSSYNLLYQIPDFRFECPNGNCYEIQLECSAVKNASFDHSLYYQLSLRNN